MLAFINLQFLQHYKVDIIILVLRLRQEQAIHYATWGFPLEYGYLSADPN